MMETPEDFRTWADIDLDALRENYRRISSVLTGGCQAMAVVKADAYGHGAVMAARIYEEEGAPYLAVSNIEEALQLRRAGIRTPILLLSYTPPEQAAVLAQHRITQAVVCAEHGEQLNAAAAAAGVTVTVHLKADTGMSRVGFFCQQNEESAAREMAAICRLPHLDAEGIFTHFAVADEPDGEGFTRQQYTRFTTVIELLRQRGITFRYRHCCNSAGILRFPEMQLDLVRPGIILYGLYPAAWMSGMLPLKPVMALKTAVSQVKTLPKGATVSYGRIFTVSRQTRVATVPIGYADGYSRRLSGKAHMLVVGQAAPVIGRICMDQCMLCVDGIDGVTAGTTVTVFGQDGHALLPVEEYAGWSDTINYESVCEVGKRVPRVFREGGRVIARQNGLLSQATELPHAAQSVRDRTERTLCDRVIAYMRANLEGHLSFEQVCRFSAQSATNLKTIFKAVTGQGVMAYYRALKIERAKELLRAGDGNVTQIADRLGYTSVHYFSRYFKQATGITPSEYMNQV